MAVIEDLDTSAVQSIVIVPFTNLFDKNTIAVVPAFHIKKTTCLVFDFTAEYQYIILENARVGQSLLV